MKPEISNLGQEISSGIRDIVDGIVSGVGNSGQDISAALTGLLGELIDLFPFILAL